VRTVPHLSRCGGAQLASRSTRRLAIMATLLFAGYGLLMASGVSQANGDVGDLGPPPAESEITQILTDFYSAAQPPGSTVDVKFDGPIIVGPPTDHANPPPRPLCVRCGSPDQGISPMYPVLAQVRVKVKYDQKSSAIYPSDPVVTTTYNGTTCPGVTKSQYCPAYYFYRDRHGNWQVA
jgi:hypothetical protein